MHRGLGGVGCSAHENSRRAEAVKPASTVPDLAVSGLGILGGALWYVVTNAPQAVAAAIIANPAPLAGTGHNGFGSVDALREEIETDTRARLVGQPPPRPLSLPSNTQGTIESFIPRGVWDAPRVNSLDSRACGSVDLADS